jgi:hypothetical protein
MKIFTKQQVRRSRLLKYPCLLSLALLPVLGCTLHGQSARPDSSIVVIQTFDNAKALGSSRLVIRDSAAFQQVWLRAWQRSVTIPAVPTMDFTRYDVIVIAAGPQGLTGGSIRLTKIESDELGRTFYITIHVPGRECIGGTAMTYHAVFVRVPHAEKTPLFRDTLVAPSCE